MKVLVEKINDKLENLQRELGYFRVVTTDNDGIFCTEVFHQKGITRAFHKVHELAVNNAIDKAIQSLKIS